MLVFYAGRLDSTIPRLENIVGTLENFQIHLDRNYYPDGSFNANSAYEAYPYG